MRCPKCEMLWTPGDGLEYTFNADIIDRMSLRSFKGSPVMHKERIKEIVADQPVPQITCPHCNEYSIPYDYETALSMLKRIYREYLWDRELENPIFAAKLTKIIISLKDEIEPHMIEEEGDTPGIDLTVGMKPDGDWGWQSGDNSYSGGAYGYQPWAVVLICEDSDPKDIIKDLIDQLTEGLTINGEAEEEEQEQNNGKA